MTWYRRACSGIESFDGLWTAYAAGRISAVRAATDGGFVYSAEAPVGAADAVAPAPTTAAIGPSDGPGIAPMRELRLREYHDLARGGARAAFRIGRPAVGRVIAELAARGVKRPAVSIATREAKQGAGGKKDEPDCVVLVEGLTQLEILRHARAWGAAVFAGPRDALRLVQWPFRLPASLERDDSDVLLLVAPPPDEEKANPAVARAARVNRTDPWDIHAFQPAFSAVRAVEASAPGDGRTADQRRPDASFQPFEVPVGLRFPAPPVRRRTSHEVVHLRQLRREWAALRRLDGLGGSRRAAIEAKAREVIDGTFAGQAFAKQALAEVESRISEIEERLADGVPIAATIAVVFLDDPGARAWTGFALQGASHAELRRLKVARARVARSPGAAPSELAVFRMDDSGTAAEPLPAWLTSVCRDDRGETYGPVPGWAGELGLLVPSSLVVSPPWALASRSLEGLGPPSAGDVRLLMPATPHAPSASPTVVIIPAAWFVPVGDRLLTTVAVAGAEESAVRAGEAMAAAERVVREWIGDGTVPVRLAAPVAGRLREAADRIRDTVSGVVRRIEAEANDAAEQARAAFAEKDELVRAMQAELDGYAAASAAEAERLRRGIEDARSKLAESARRLGEETAALEMRVDAAATTAEQVTRDVHDATEAARTGFEALRERIQYMVLDRQGHLEQTVEVQLQNIHRGADEMVARAPAEWAALLDSIPADRRDAIAAQLAALVPVAASAVARAVPRELLVDAIRRLHAAAERAFLGQVAALLGDASATLSEIPAPHLADRRARAASRADATGGPRPGRSAGATDGSEGAL